MVWKKEEGEGGMEIFVKMWCVNLMNGGLLVSVVWRVCLVKVMRWIVKEVKGDLL